MALALGLGAFAVLYPAPALADGTPYVTVIDSIVPKVNGLNIQGASGGCDILLQNNTGQDVLLFDMSKPPKPFRFAALPKGASPRPPVPVHLAGAWPCASLPAVTEDQRWNHQPATVGIWSITGAVGAVTFKMSGRSVYDPALDPSGDLTFYLRIAAGIAAVGGLLLAAPYLIRRRRETFKTAKKAA